MTPVTCVGCGSLGRFRLFDRLDLVICRSCRDLLLTAIADSGSELSDRNWLCAELCENSHALESSWWKFVDYKKMDVRSVLRLVKN